MYKINGIPLNLKTTEEFFKNWTNYAAKFYENAKIDRKQILEENKGKSGIYLWYNRINEKYYIGQSLNLGGVKMGRFSRYYRQSYLKEKGQSIIRAALLKYGHENFSVIILDFCSIELLDEREQYWIDLLKPDYNILRFVKSSRGYTHTPHSIDKMRGPRPDYKPSPEHLVKLGVLAKNRVYDNTFRDKLSER
jgi:group I intron endonuclease